jgi:hypothetical protein
LAYNIVLIIFGINALNCVIFLYTCINSALKYNFVLYSTISESYYSSGSPYGTIWLEGGQIAVISTNSSNNNGYYDSSFHLYAYDNSESSSQLNFSKEYDSYLHYCYIINGYSKYFGCLRFHYYKHTCDESNIINNSQETSDWGTFINHVSYIPTTKIIKCCVIKNNLNNKGYLFCVGGGTMEVRECTIPNGYNISGAVTTNYNNNKISTDRKEFINCYNMWKVDDNQHKIICSDWDIVLLHKIHIIWTILKYIKLVCYNNIFIKYTIIMYNICILCIIYCTISQYTYNIMNIVLCAIYRKYCTIIQDTYNISILLT